MNTAQPESRSVVRTGKIQITAQPRKRNDLHTLDPGVKIGAGSLIGNRIPELQCTFTDGELIVT